MITPAPNWVKIPADELSVNWRNVVSDRRSGMYGGGARLIKHNSVSRVELPSSLLTFLKCFGIIFTPVFTLTGFWFIPDAMRWFFVFAAPVVGGSAFYFFYRITAHEISNGPYIEFDSDTQRITIPRYNLSVGANEAVAFQWFSGRSSKFDTYRTDLYLLARGDDEPLLRYHVMGAPSRTDVRVFAKCCDLPVQEIDVGRRGRRDIDVDDPHVLPV